MNSFSEYMDKVKAEKELKIKTETFVRAAFSSTEREKKTADSGSEFRRKRFAFNKLLAAVSAVAACLVLVLCGNAYYHTPVNYLCLDINPSVELGLNAFGRVVSTQAYNEDGLRLLKANQYMSLSAEDAVEALVQDAMKLGFIAEDGSTVISVTAESSKNKIATELQNDGESGANSALSADGISAIVYTDGIDLQLRKQAQHLEISPGKLRLILILQTLDPGITIEECRYAKMTDIIAKANELLTGSGNSWECRKDAEILGKIRNAAQQVQAAYANEEREHNRNSPQNQNQGPGEQEQNQKPEQGSNDSGAQNQVQNQGLETKQQIPSQSSSTLQQQAQKPEEQMPNQLQGGDTSVSSPNKGQTADTQSGNIETVQGNGGGAQTAAASTENRAETSGNEYSSGVQSGNGKGGR